MKKLVFCIVVLLQVQLLQAQVILIDPGHGRCDHPEDAGTSYGVTYNHDTRLLTELQTSVAVGLKLRTLIENSSCNWTVHMSRENNNIGSWISPNARRALSNSMGADLFLSIHTNAFELPSANGTETFWCQFSNSASQAFAESLHAIYVNAVSVFPIVHRRVVEFNSYRGFHLGALNGNNAISCLNELAFGTNPTEDAILNDDSNRDLFAEAYFDALQAELSTNCAQGCPQSATVNNNSISGTTTVSSFITSTGDVPAGNNALFDAGDYIDLQTGFEAAPGSVFEGQIAGCTALRRGVLDKKHRLQSLHQHQHAKNSPTVHVFKNSKDHTLVFKKENIDVEKISIYDEEKSMIDDVSFSESFSLKDYNAGTYYFRFYSEDKYFEHIEKVILL